MFALGLCGGAHADVLALPPSLELIGEEAFMGDTSLDRVELGDAVAEIGPRAFADSSLRGINLPESLKTISDDAFDGVRSLNVSAVKGTHAYEWAVENGFMRKNPLRKRPCSSQA